MILGGLIFFANIVQAVFFTWWDMDPGHAEHRKFDPWVGFLLTITNLRLPVTALLDSFQILSKGISPDDTKSPKHQAIDKIFTGASNIVFLKVFEIMFETVPELLLETYIAAYQYFIQDKESGSVDAVLIVAVCIGLLSLSTGIYLFRLHMRGKVQDQDRGGLLFQLHDHRSFRDARGSLCRSRVEFVCAVGVLPADSLRPRL